MSGRLAGAVALVTGGARGIGRAIAERFVAEGATVYATDLDEEGAAAVADARGSAGDGYRYVRASVTEEGDWSALARQVESEAGRLDILVNNAGIDLTGPVEGLSLPDWRRIMAINVDGVFLGTRAFTPLLAASGAMRRGGSSIVNVSSIMGLVGMSEVSAYNASKGAVRLFTKGIAIEFAQKRMPIRANSLHPGFVRTPLLDAGFQRWVDNGGAEKTEDLVAMMEGATPVGRLADAAELAGPALFLASEDASYMTGAELVIDGGWTAQ